MASTDRTVMEGKLHVKQHKFGKKWKGCHVLLYPDSPFGVARLEFYDWKDGPIAGDKTHTRRAGDRKVVRLAECVCVAPVPSESGPKDNMVAFSVETSEKTILLSTDRTLAGEWINKLCELAFSTKSTPDKELSEPSQTVSIEMAVNSLYVSREEVSEFLVTVQRTEAAERCSLHGSYILRTDQDCLLLIDPDTRETLFTWPFKLLRRYGRDKVMFSFEAGRRCTSGPGNFTFETSQGHEIFQRVESSIRAQQGPENQLPALDIDSTVESVSGSNVPPGKDTEEKVLKGRTLPNIPVPKPATPLNLLEPSAVSSNSSTPPRSPLAHCASRSVGVDSDHLIGVYSEPKDSVKRMNPQFDSLYSDPVDCVAGNVKKGQRSQTEPSVTSPLYSDIYEHVGYETVGGAVPPILKNRPAPLSPGEEHIYDEPEGMAQRAEPPQVYSEVQMEVGSWKRHAADEKLGYEFPYNPNTDDYSVPNSQGQWSQPRNRGIGPKPVPAPKPQGIVISKAAGKEVDLLNSNNNNSSEVIYSQVQKKEGARGKGPKFQMEPPEPAASPSIPLMPHAAKPQTVPLFLQSASVLSVPSLPLPPVPPVPLPNKPPQTLSLITKPLTASPVSTPVKSQNAPPHRWPVPPNKITSASALANPPNVPASIQLHQLLGTSDDEELSSSEGTQMSTIYEDMGVL